jgi:hypothetical protein
MVLASISYCKRIRAVECTCVLVGVRLVYMYVYECVVNVYVTVDGGVCGLEFVGGCGVRALLVAGGSGGRAAGRQRTDLLLRLPHLVVEHLPTHAATLTRCLTLHASHIAHFIYFFHTYTTYLAQIKYH